MFRNSIHIGIRILLSHSISILLIRKDIPLMNSTLLALNIITKLIHLLLEEGVVLLARTSSTHWGLLNLIQISLR